MVVVMFFPRGAGGNTFLLGDVVIRIILTYFFNLLYRLYHRSLSFQVKCFYLNVFYSGRVLYVWSFIIINGYGSGGVFFTRSGGDTFSFFGIYSLWVQMNEFHENLFNTFFWSLILVVTIIIQLNGPFTRYILYSQYPSRIPKSHFASSTHFQHPSRF